MSIHPPSQEAPPPASLEASQRFSEALGEGDLGGEEGEVRVLLRSRAGKATAKQNTMASERFRPTGGPESATGSARGAPQLQRGLKLAVRRAQ